MVITTPVKSSTFAVDTAALAAGSVEVVYDQVSDQDTDT